MFYVTERLSLDNVKRLIAAFFLLIAIYKKIIIQLIMVDENSINEIIGIVKNKILKEAAKKRKEKLVVPNVDWIYGWYCHFNKTVFNNFLQLPKFSARCDKEDWGCYIPEVGTFRYKETPGTLCLNGMYKRTEREWLGTLLHEMCHQYVCQNRGFKFKDSHGTDFMKAVDFVNNNKDVKSRNIVVLKDDYADTIEADGTEKYEYYKDEKGKKVYSNQGRCIICIIENDNGNGYKYWLALIKQNEVSIAKKSLRKAKIQNYKFFYINSEKLSNADTNPELLSGFGGMSYEDAVVKMGSYYGEFEYEKFDVNNLVSVK